MAPKPGTKMPRGHGKAKLGPPYEMVDAEKPRGLGKLSKEAFDRINEEIIAPALAEEEAAPVTSAFADDPIGTNLVQTLSNIIWAKLGAGNDPQDYERMLALLSGMSSALIVARCFGDTPSALALLNRVNCANTEQVTKLIHVYPEELETALAK